MSRHLPEATGDSIFRNPSSTDRAQLRSAELVPRRLHRCPAMQGSCVVGLPPPPLLRCGRGPQTSHNACHTGIGIHEPLHSQPRTQREIKQRTQAISQTRHVRRKKGHYKDTDQAACHHLTHLHLYKVLHTMHLATQRTAAVADSVARPPSEPHKTVVRFVKTCYDGPIVPKGMVKPGPECVACGGTCRGVPHSNLNLLAGLDVDDSLSDATDVETEGLSTSCGSSLGRPAAAGGATGEALGMLPPLLAPEDRAKGSLFSSDTRALCASSCRSTQATKPNTRRQILGESCPSAKLIKDTTDNKRW